MSNRVTVDGKTHLWPHNLKNVLKLLKKIGNNAELFRTGMSFKEADLAQNQHSYEKVFSGERRPKALKNCGNRGFAVLYGQEFQKSIQQIIHSALKQQARGASLRHKPISPSLSFCPAGGDPSDTVRMMFCVVAQAHIPWLMPLVSSCSPM